MSTSKINWQFILKLHRNALVAVAPGLIACGAIAQSSSASQPATVFADVQSAGGSAPMTSGTPQPGRPDVPTVRPLQVAPFGKPLPVSPRLEQVAPELVKGPLKLSDAVAIALAINPALDRAGRNVEFYSGKVTEARAGLHPTLAVVPGEQFLHTLATEGYGFQATLPLDISHLLTSATQQAQFEQVGARLEVNRIRNEIVYGVKQGFFGVLRAQALGRVAQINLQDSLDRLRDSQVRYKAQAVAYIDVLRAQTDVADAQKQLIQTQTDERRAVAELALRMGIDVNTPLVISERDSIQLPPGVSAQKIAIHPDTSGLDATELTPAPDPEKVIPEDAELAAKLSQAKIEKAAQLGPEYERALEEALHTRPEIWEADAQIAAARAGVTVARRTELPSFLLNLGYYDLRSVTGTRYNEPQAFVGFSVPLYDGGIARGRVQSAKALVQDQISAHREAIDSVSRDVQNAYLTLVQTQAQIAVATQALAQAQAAFALARVRYNTGVSTRPGVSPIIEVSDAQVALTLAEQNQVNAIYDYNEGEAQLDRATGRYAFVLNDRSGLDRVPDRRRLEVSSPSP